MSFQKTAVAVLASLAVFSKTAVAILASLAVFSKTAVAVVMRLSRNLQPRLLLLQKFLIKLKIGGN